VPDVAQHFHRFVGVLNAILLRRDFAGLFANLARALGDSRFQFFGLRLQRLRFAARLTLLVPHYRAPGPHHSEQQYQAVQRIREAAPIPGREDRECVIRLFANLPFVAARFYP